MAARELPDGLLAAVRLRLHITWQDDSTDANLTEMIQQGMNYLDAIAGESLDYSTPGTDARTLLFEYVRYVRDYALDVFEANYRSLLLALQHSRQLARKPEGSEDHGE